MKMNQAAQAAHLTAGQRILRYIPLWETLRNYRRSDIRKDLVAALTVAVVAIPQSMAYAVIAGVNPAYGLYTAIISTMIASAFGSSSHLIAGPTNAISLLIASNMKSYLGMDNFMEILFLLTFLTGALQIVFAVLRLGRALNYVSHAVVVGFTAAAGILIALGQLNQLLGISIPNSASLTTLEKMGYVFTHLGKTNPYALGIGVFTMAVILIFRRIHRSLPGSLIGMILSVIMVVALALESKGVRLTGEIPASLPVFQLIRLDMGLAKGLFGKALAIAIIGLVEAISIAKSIASTSCQKIDANQEFIGQGLANAAGSFFQCFAGSGSFTRSAVNYISGAATRISGILSGIFVALTLLLLGGYARYIPMASLAGVIMVIAYGMVNRKEIKKVHTVGRSDAIVMWATFGGTLLLPDLDTAIYLGVILSIGLYLRDTNKVPVKILLPSGETGVNFEEVEVSTVNEPVDVMIIQIEGSLYFGSAEDLESKLESLRDKSRVFILRMKRVQTIDITSLDALKTFIGRVKAAGGTVFLCGVSAGLNSILINSELAGEIGADHIFLSEGTLLASSRKALEKAREVARDNACRMA